MFKLLLEWLLRLFGVFWILGGCYALRQAQLANLLDSAMEKISMQSEDRLVSRFLFLGSLLTLISGIGLAMGSRWALLPLGLLVVSQILYFAMQDHRFRNASSQEARQDATINPATVNAFKVTLVISALALVGQWMGALD